MMKKKELRRLNRAELLELLLAQTRETERLQEKLREAEEKLADRILKYNEAGDLAHAALAINGVMESAQLAARQYLESIEAMKAETKLTCEKLICEAEKEAEMIRNGAKTEENG